MPDGPRHAAWRERDGFYPYSGPPEHVEVYPEHRRGALRMTEVRFPSLVPSGHAQNDTARARLFRHRERSPGQPIVFLHGFGQSWLWLWESFAMTLAARGFPTLLVCLPYLCERSVPEFPHGSAYSSTDASVALPAYEQAVADTRAALDWLLSSDEGAPVPGRPGPAILGVSLGAMVGIIAAALDRRFESVVAVLGGGDLHVIVFQGSLRTIVERQLEDRNVTVERRRAARETYRRYLDDVRHAGHPLDVSPAHAYFLFDPLTFAWHLRSRPVLMLNARVDPIIPRPATLQLWNELGQPPISWLWGTHWAGGPWKPYVMRRITGFLRDLEPGETRVPADSSATIDLDETV
jgi:pimeloyl-ACP methyl ester carboxylesterase